MGIPGVFHGDLFPGVVDAAIFEGAQGSFLLAVVSGEPLPSWLSSGLGDDRAGLMVAFSDEGVRDEFQGAPAAEDSSLGFCGDHPPLFWADEIASGVFHGVLPAKDVAESVVFWGDHGAFFPTLGGGAPEVAHEVLAKGGVVSFGFISSCDFFCDQGVMFWVFDEGVPRFFQGTLSATVDVDPDASPEPPNLVCCDAAAWVDSSSLSVFGDAVPKDFQGALAPGVFDASVDSYL